ncbi:hypothetical protein COTS27_01575 [Spirochaetota bacterium]|nr:hypothetical protein COTS27_01575 [Spirochaetota bacterium]
MNNKQALLFFNFCVTFLLCGGLTAATSPIIAPLLAEDTKHTLSPAQKISQKLFKTPRVQSSSQTKPAPAAPKKAGLSPSPAPQIAIIPIVEEIAPATFKFLERATSEAIKAGATHLVFKINTFGGRLDAAYNIVHLISSLATPEVKTIAWVEDKAISAGTLIALSCNNLYMMPGSTLGDVAPIVQGGEGGVTVLGEKFQSPLRAKFRALAEKNGYPVKLTEAFVSADKIIYEITYKDGSQTFLNDTEYGDLTEKELATIAKKRTVVAEGELLTMNEQEALSLGFSRGTTTELAEIIDSATAFTENDVTTYELMTSEKIVGYIAKYAGILIFIALAGLYLEAQNPGFGVFGGVAIFALIVLCLGLFAVELATYGEIALLIAGIVLIGIEIFILPGIGIAGLSGLLCILVSMLLMLQDFSFPDTVFELELFRQNIITIAIAFVGGTAVFFLSFVLFKNWRRTNPFVLHSTLAAAPVTSTTSTTSTTSDKSSSPPATTTPNPLHNNSSDSHNNNDPDNAYTSLINTSGTSLSDLRPSGKVEINGVIYDAITEGEYIKKNMPIKVFGVHGASLLVGKMSG